MGVLIPLGNIIGPLIVWLFARRRSDFINQHGKETINFQLSMTIWCILLPVLFFSIAFHIVVLFTGAIIGLWFLIFYIMQTINSSVEAKKGAHYRYPLTIRLIK
ncbi:MAG: DUF4870 domain-containing protein [archaeon]|nr:DUF4870 domain-containing protein [archaeon]